MNKKVFEEGFVSTNRLFLRSLSRDDKNNFLSLVMQQEVGFWLPRGRALTESEGINVFDGMISYNERESFGIMSVFRKSDNSYIGYCGIRKVPSSNDLEIIYALKKEYRSEGYCTEACLKVMEMGRSILKFSKILGLAKQENFDSMNVLRRLGFEDMGYKKILGIECRYFEKNFEMEGNLWVF